MADEAVEVGESGQFSSFVGQISPEMDSGMIGSHADVLNMEDNLEMMADDYVEGDDNITDFDDIGASLSGDEGTHELSNGQLDEEVIGQGLSNLGRSADGTYQVFLNLTLPGYGLKDISALEEYIHLQKVELPYNEITDLTPLGNMPFLLELDASHNQISTLLDFEPPKNLKVVDLSFNNIEEMKDLGAHHYLNKLVLDNNHIEKVQGLSECRRLSHLSMAHNRLECIQGLDHLPIKNLNLSGNNLTKIENIETLNYLESVNFSGNKIRSMNGLQKHDFLAAVDLEGNEVIDLSEIQYIQSLQLLRELNLQRNPVRELPDYRLSVLFYIQRLTELDRRRVDVDEKVAATNMFNPPLEVVAARDHIMHVVYAFLQPNRVQDSTLTSMETPYPMLVLVGPQGSGKKDLALKLVEEFPDYFGFGISHTTRKPHGEEAQGKEYFFATLEEFENEIKMGKFLQTTAHNGQLYGLTRDSIETVARDGLACITHMELEGVLTLKNTHLQPRYVLILPISSEAHERRLRERNLYSEMEIKLAVEKAEVYAEHNREHPGFFDMMINSDDITEAYKKLRHLVMDYLGIHPATPSQSELDRGNTDLSLLDKEPTMDTSNNNPNSANLARTWSRHSVSLSESLNQALLNIKNKAQSPMPQMGRGIVEEQSLKRRQSAAKDAVTGHVPSLYEQVLNKSPKSVPQPVSSQVGLGETTRGYRSYSAPAANMDALPPSSPDSSRSGAESDSDLSNISEARDAADDDEEEEEEECSTRGSTLILPEEALDPLELLSGSASKNLSSSNPSVPLAPRPGSSGARHGLETPRSGSAAESRPGTGQGSRSASACSGRPGSDRHPVLPPIGQTPEPVPAVPVL